MAHGHGTPVPQIIGTGAPRVRRLGARTFTATLRNDRGYPLFQLTTRAGSAAEVGARAQAAYGDLLRGIGEQRDLTDDAASLLVDPAQTIVAPSRTPDSLRISYLARIAGEMRPDAASRALGKDEAVALLRNAIDADPGMHHALTGGETIDLCPAHTWSPRTGWITIDCCFRVSGPAGRARSINPASWALRTTARLVVLRLLLRSRETVHQPLAQRRSVASHTLPSATLRALRRATGPREPASLIGWLREHGHFTLAAILTEEIRR
jgi:hypothetical protein